MTPNRVNRAHWPTRENRQILYILFDFFGPWRKLPGMALNGAGKLFFRPVQTLPTFWATWILIVFVILMFVDSEFQDVQAPKFWISQNQDFPTSPGLGQWALFTRFGQDSVCC